MNPASPLPVPATPASGLGRPGLSRPPPDQPRREAGQVPRAQPKALKSKTVATQEELKQVVLRLSPAAPLPPASAGEPADPPHPSSGLGVQSRAEGGSQARSFVRRARAGRGGAGAQPPAVRASPQSRAPHRPPSPPRGPAAASASPLRPEAPRPPAGARKLRVQRAGEEAGRPVLGADGWTGSRPSWERRLRRMSV